MQAFTTTTSPVFELIDRIVARGGPRPEDYPALDQWASVVHEAVATGGVSRAELPLLRARFGQAFSPATLQGFALAKPHGYAGDFEMMERIYAQCVTPIPNLKAWDIFWQSHAAPVAVRNRKTYFHQLLDAHCRRRQPLRVLKVASGPGRSMFEWLSANPAAAITIDCVEVDVDAIAYAARLNEPFLDRITFMHKNALRFRPNRRYDLIWSAGLFDYFNDVTFGLMIRRLLPAIAPGGELVIGNFSEHNPSRSWMELSEWFLHHRSRARLCALAEQSGVDPTQIAVGQEPQGVNLFLHIAGESEGAESFQEQPDPTSTVARGTESSWRDRAA